MFIFQAQLHLSPETSDLAHSIAHKFNAEPQNELKMRLESIVNFLRPADSFKKLTDAPAGFSSVGTAIGKIIPLEYIKDPGKKKFDNEQQKLDFTLDLAKHLLSNSDKFLDVSGLVFKDYEVNGKKLDETAKSFADSWKPAKEQPKPNPFISDPRIESLSKVRGAGAEGFKELEKINEKLAKEREQKKKKN